MRLVFVMTSTASIGYSQYATVINFINATLCTIPFVYVGAQFAGATDALIGHALGTILFGTIALAIRFCIIDECSGSDGPIPGPKNKPFNLRMPIWPQSNISG